MISAQAKTPLGPLHVVEKFYRTTKAYRSPKQATRRM